MRLKLEQKIELPIVEHSLLIEVSRVRKLRLLEWGVLKPLADIPNVTLEEMQRELGIEDTAFLDAIFKEMRRKDIISPKDDSYLFDNNDADSQDLLYQLTEKGRTLLARNQMQSTAEWESCVLFYSPITEEWMHNQHMNIENDRILIRPNYTEEDEHSTISGGNGYLGDQENDPEHQEHMDTLKYVQSLDSASPTQKVIQDSLKARKTKATEFIISDWKEEDKEYFMLPVSISLSLNRYPPYLKYTLDQRASFFKDPEFSQRKINEEYSNSIATSLSKLGLTTQGIAHSEEIIEEIYPNIRQILPIKLEGAKRIWKQINIKSTFQMSFCWKNKELKGNPHMDSISISSNSNIHFNFVSIKDYSAFFGLKGLGTISLTKKLSKNIRKEGDWGTPIIFFGRENSSFDSIVQLDIPTSSTPYRRTEESNDILEVFAELKDEERNRRFKVYVDFVKESFLELSDELEHLLVQWRFINPLPAAQKILKTFFAGEKPNENYERLKIWLKISKSLKLPHGISSEIVKETCDLMTITSDDEGLDFLKEIGIPSEEINKLILSDYSLSIPIWSEIEGLKEIMNTLSNARFGKPLMYEKVVEEIKAFRELLTQAVEESLSDEYDLPDLKSLEQMKKLFEKRYDYQIAPAVRKRFNASPLPAIDDLEGIKIWVNYVDFFKDKDIIEQFCSSVDLESSDGWFYTQPTIDKEVFRILRGKSFTWQRVSSFFNSKFEGKLPFNGKFNDIKVIKEQGEKWEPLLIFLKKVERSLMLELIDDYPICTNKKEVNEWITITQLALCKELKPNEILSKCIPDIMHDAEIREILEKHRKINQGQINQYLKKHTPKEDKEIKIDDQEITVESLIPEDILETDTIQLVVDGGNLMRDQLEPSEKNRMFGEGKRLLVLLKKLKEEYQIPIGNVRIIVSDKTLNSVHGSQILRDLKERGILLSVHGKEYDDLYILNMARKHNARILSNDQFRDVQEEKNKEGGDNDLKEWLKNNRISYIWDKLAKDITMPSLSSKLE